MVWTARRNPSEELAFLRGEVADLEAYCSVLKGLLMAGDIEPPPLPFYMLRGLPQQPRILLGLLLGAWPYPVHQYDLLERMPGGERGDPLDRDARMVAILVHTVRKKLGFDAIETVWGSGYRLGDALHAELLKQRTAEVVS